MSIVFNKREPQAHVDPIFLDRWSPRALSREPVPESMIESLFEAARWAPSCYNEQPWLFIYAATEEDLSLYRPLLVEGNRQWADNAPVLAFALARKNFARNNKPNDWAAFDTGAAWMSLALQARRLGLYAHAMAGILKDKVYEVLNIPRDEYEVICAIAIGRYGDPSQLPASLKSSEIPNKRKSLNEVAVQGKFSD
ncbi:MAG: nitroreductase [Candidatus Latescibacteria bacterium]|nr:nitroreductase [Candidatus Latescibacterota bacterium]NIO28449.1 nitroreductase [Candidatus Latescibacterota bacterium]NIO55998.1 nitroreductase [Candidatus Latescibacterota bacterium]NIT01962.1 nitroreductase [Candidatus Latescibacterota bacterium]